MAKNSQYMSGKGRKNFRALQHLSTDQNGYVDDYSVVSALPLKLTSTDF